MANKLLQLYRSKVPAEQLYLVYGAIVLLSIFAGIISEWYFLAGIPAFVILFFVSLLNFRVIYLFLLACIPLSTEIVLPNGFGTDLPTEPLIIGLMFLFGIYVLQKGRQLNTAFIRHPITLLLLVHVTWIFTSTITSELFLVSFKFSLAKTWYLVTFFFLTGYLIKDEKDFKTLFWVIFIPLTLTVFITLVRHAGYGFSFEYVYRVLHPFQRNHVNYAATIALFFPITALALGWYEYRSRPWWLLVGALALFLIAIYFSFTRAAYISLVIAAGAYFVIQFKMTRYVLTAASIAAIIGIGYMAYNNNYLDYAPNYERTISHTSFDNLVEATYKMEDISTMERVYRWVAGFQMSTANPVFGFGPGNFVNFYKTYTVTSFQTYVSDNEDLSGIHSYFLMTLVEQGYVGLFLFVLLCFYSLVKAEQIYHRCKDPGRKRIIMMVTLCLIVIYSFLIINDLIETDKIGSFFFICLAVLVNQDISRKTALPSPS